MGFNKIKHIIECENKEAKEKTKDYIGSTRTIIILSVALSTVVGYLIYIISNEITGIQLWAKIISLFFYCNTVNITFYSYF